MRNPVVRKGEHGGFKWCFRRFWLDVETLSGNFKARFMAGEHPYGYLVAGKNDSNIEGYNQILYEVAMLLTTDQGLVDDIVRALNKYQGRVDKAAKVEEDETLEKIDLESVKSAQERSELPKRYRKKKDRQTNRKFKKVIKEMGNEEEGR